VTYLEVDGHQVWHEVSGDGPPVVLLHGAFAGASSFAMMTPALVTAGFEVYVPERRGHSHTPDVEGPLSYSVMADDTIGYLDQVLPDGASLVGWSDGAVVALLVALRRPDLVHRMVLIGQYYNMAGRVPDSDIDALLRSPEAMNFLRHEYDQVSPDGPDHFPVVYEKTIRMLETEPDLDLGDLNATDVPTLVLQGDRDEVTLDHSLAVVDALRNARLAVLPGTHLLPAESPDVVNPLLISFLRGGPGAPSWSSSTEGE
jgi:pimeloyl-ACP methyl ester carboxylesterase